MSTAAREVFVGIDVSKDSLDCFMRPEGTTFSVPNREPEIERLVEQLKGQGPTLIVLEATGGLEMAAVSALAAADLPVVAVNPRQVRAFAKAVGKLAKTDRIDAEVLAHFGDATRPPVRPLKDTETQQLSALLVRRRQIIDMLTQEKNRQARAPLSIRADIQLNVRWLEKRLEEIDAKLNKTVRKSPVWREKDDLLRSVPGVGSVLSTTLIADLPELGKLDGRKISVLVGVAPLNCDSGVFKGTRRIWGGRARVRHVLYMATVAALRYNPVIHAYHQRLIAAGKKPKVAIVACMHKLLLILNAMMKSGTLWRRDPSPA